MTLRAFELSFDNWEERPPVVCVAPPTYELYEALCRADVERVVRVAERRSSKLAGMRVSLEGQYPDTVVRITGLLEGRRADYEWALYRPRFRQLRHGRLTSPHLLSESISYRFQQPLGFLWPDAPVHEATMYVADVRDIARSLEPALQRPAVDVDREGDNMRLVLTARQADHEIVVDSLVFAEGRRRAAWRVGEELADRAARAAGVELELGEPTLSFGADYVHLPSNGGPDT